MEKRIEKSIPYFTKDLFLIYAREIDRLLPGIFLHLPTHQTFRKDIDYIKKNLYDILYKYYKTSLIKMTDIQYAYLDQLFFFVLSAHKKKIRIPVIEEMTFESLASYVIDEYGGFMLHYINGSRKGEENLHEHISGSHPDIRFQTDPYDRDPSSILIHPDFIKESIDIDKHDRVNMDVLYNDLFIKTAGMFELIKDEYASKSLKAQLLKDYDTLLQDIYHDLYPYSEMMHRLYDLRIIQNTKHKSSDLHKLVMSFQVCMITCTYYCEVKTEEAYRTFLISVIQYLNKILSGEDHLKIKYLRMTNTELIHSIINYVSDVLYCFDEYNVYKIPLNMVPDPQLEEIELTRLECLYSIKGFYRQVTKYAESLTGFENALCITYLRLAKKDIKPNINKELKDYVNSKKIRFDTVSQILTNNYKITLALEAIYPLEAVMDHSTSEYQIVSSLIEFILKKMMNEPKHRDLFETHITRLLKKCLSDESAPEFYH